jgi:tRNA uridine 5-carbamoylmethylation protein Kti12
VWCLGGDEKCDLGSRFEPPNEKNRWDRPLVLARRSSNDGKMEFDFDRVMDAVAGVPASAPNLSTIAEPRALAHNADELLSECVAEIMGQQKEGIGKLARHVTMAGILVFVSVCFCFEIFVSVLMIC